MTTSSVPTVVGCLIDVSESMREAFEARDPNESATKRFDAILYAALRIVQTEYQHDPNALMFVGAFGLKDKYPQMVDFRSVVEAIVGDTSGRQDGHELLIAISRTEMTKDEAMIVHAHLRRYPERVDEFVQAIPGSEELKNKQDTALTWGQVGGAALAGGVVIATGGIGALAGGAIGLAGGVLGKAGASYAVDKSVKESKAIQFAHQICDEWLQDFSSFVPRPVSDVVDLLNRLQSRTTTGGGEVPGRSRNTLPDILSRYMYGSTPMRDALSEALRTFRQSPAAKNRGLVLLSDGKSTDGDPRLLGKDLRDESVKIATVYLTKNRVIPERRLYYQKAETFDEGQVALFELASRVPCVMRPIPVLASFGWQVPSSGECALYVAVCSTTVLDEFCSMLFSTRFGSTNELLDIIGREQQDKVVNDEHVRARQSPSNQGKSWTCYAHAAAVVLHMALCRIVGLEKEKGRPKYYFPKFPANDRHGRNVEEVLTWAFQSRWVRPLKFQEVDEDRARQAVLHRRPVLTTFHLSESGWATFYEHYGTPATSRSVLTRDKMAVNRLPPVVGGHAVVLIGCSPNSLTLLNSWGRDWGDDGCFIVEDHTVLQTTSHDLRVKFYNVFWRECDLRASERNAYYAGVDDRLRGMGAQYASLLEVETQCPACRHIAPISDFHGDLSRVECPQCHRSFAPQPGHLLQAFICPRTVVHTTTGCGEQGFPSAQPYLSHTPVG
ncbi:hypothetical protein BJX65DRAFT_299836 [Aspergillus insuetus]